MKLELGLMHLLEDLERSSDTGRPIKDAELAQHLSIKRDVRTPLDANRVKDFAVKCGYAMEHNERLVITKLGVLRAKRAPAMPAFQPQAI